MSFADAHATAKLYEQDIALLEFLATNFVNPSPDPMTQAAFLNGFSEVSKVDLSVILDGETRAAILASFATCYEDMKTALKNRKDALTAALEALDCS